SPALHKLEKLDLSGNDLTDTAVDVIAAAWPSLRELDLAFNEIGSRGARGLGAGGRSLGVLGVRGNHVAPPGLSALAASSGMKSLKALDLTHNPVGGPQAKAVVTASAYLPRDGVTFDDDPHIRSNVVLEELRTLPEAADITALKLVGGDITD